MTFVGAISTCFRRYASFSGRASRSEYWWFMLFVFAGNVAAGFLDGLIFGFERVEYDAGGVAYETTGWLGAAFSLATLPPSLSAGWRRMHDSGRSGLYLLYPLIVIVGIFTFVGILSGFHTVLAGDFAEILAGGSLVVLGIAVFVFFLSPLLVLWWLTRPSDPEPNAYGPPPSHIVQPSD